MSGNMRLIVPSWARSEVYDRHVEGDVFDVFLLQPGPGETISDRWLRSRQRALGMGSIFSIESYAVDVLLSDELEASYDPLLLENVLASREIASRPAFDEYYANFYQGPVVAVLAERLRRSAHVIADLPPCVPVRLGARCEPQLLSSGERAYALSARDALVALERLSDALEALLRNADSDSIVCFDGP